MPTTNAAMPPMPKIRPNRACNDVIIQKLAYAARKRTAATFQVCQWVMNNLEIAWEDIDMVDVPSAGAVSLLKMAKSNDKSRDFFFKEFVAKTMPTRTEMTSIDRSVDDGKTDQELIESFQRTITDADRATLRRGALDRDAEPRTDG